MNYNFNILPTNSALVYCKPSASIRLKDVNGSTQYIALDNDPQTVLCDAVTHKQLRLSPGTYVILFHAVPNDGSLKNPILYVNYGQGYFEGKKNCFKFTERDKNIWVCDFEIKEKARGLRFDPSIEPVKFFIERMALFNSAHEIIIPRSRVSKFLVSAKNKFSRKKIENENQDTHRISVHSLLKSSNKEPESAIYTQNYRQTLSFAEGGCDASYAPIRTSAVTVAKDEPRVIAFYLPQYHPIPENDKWWGRGFTEWTNVSKATAQFLGHYQPRLPGELGYYDLRLPDIMQRQIELAKLYGVTGFCFHYYWFDGHRLLEKPLDLFLSQKGKGFELDFCLCWANENWTRRWDGSESDILIQQNHSEDDNRRVFLDLLKYLQDPRYIKIDGKPVIVLYRPAIIPDIQKLAALWREEAVKAGFPGLYLISTNSFEFDDPASIDFDALCQFPPHGLWKHLDVKTDQVEKLNEAFSGLVYEYQDVVNVFQKQYSEAKDAKHDTPVFPCVMTGWDNEARKPTRGHVFHNATPQKFYNWFRSAMDYSRTCYKGDERLVFVNAWNEWAEGTYLEPDRRYGYAWLQAIGTERMSRSSNRRILEPLAAKLQDKRVSDIVLIIHIFYDDLIEEFSEAIAEIRKLRDVDVIITIPDSFHAAAAEKIIQKINPKRLIVTRNQGRDALPFFEALKIAEGLGYIYGCKLHSKKSMHMNNDSGNQWRKGLRDGLIGQEAFSQAFEIFAADPKIGIIAPEEAFLPAKKIEYMLGSLPHIKQIMTRAGFSEYELQDFPAGTMFWFRFDAFKAINALNYVSDDFEPELGQVDATLAHAFERAFTTLVVAQNYKIGKYCCISAASPYYGRDSV